MTRIVAPRTPFASGQRMASMREIGPIIKQQLVNTNVALADAIVWVARNKMPKFRGPVTIFLHLRRVRANAELARGGGRYGTVVLQLLDVFIQLQKAVDTSDSDEHWLFDDDGIIAVEDAVLDALQEFTPTDAKGNALTTKPIFLISELERDKTAGRPVYGDSVMTFEISHQPPLTIPERGNGRQLRRG